MQACRGARQHLLQIPALLPRDPYGRARWDAYLQHHRHAEALVWFLVRHFPAGPNPLPRAGMDLVVHARYDTTAVPAERLNLCAGGAGPRAAKPELHIFNWTGAGLEGYHYDALLVRDSPTAVDDAPLPGNAASSSLLRRRRQDGKGRIIGARAEVLDLRSPPRAPQAEAAPPS